MILNWTRRVQTDNPVLNYHFLRPLEEIGFTIELEILFHIIKVAVESESKGNEMK